MFYAPMLVAVAVVALLGIILWCAILRECWFLSISSTSISEFSNILCPMPSFWQCWLLDLWLKNSRTEIVTLAFLHAQLRFNTFPKGWKFPMASLSH